MFKHRPKTQRIDTLIGAGTRIIGDVQFTGGFHVDGHIKGNVDAPQESGSTLSVSDAGVVEGSVAVPNVILNGAVTGDILAQERVELGATARVSGNVYYGLIEMEMGAEINGKLVHGPRKAQAPAAPANKGKGKVPTSPPPSADSKR